MAKIDFSKVERQLTEALHSMFIKKLYEGKPSVSKCAVTFYAMDTGPRPKPRDAVIDELEAIEKDQKEIEKLEIERKRQEEDKIRKGLLEQEYVEGAVEKEQPTSIVETRVKEIPIEIAKSSLQELPEREYIPTTDETQINHPSILLLRKLVVWMKQKKVVDLFKHIGTSEEEYIALRQKTELNPTEEKRVEEILERAKVIKGRILIKLGIDDDAQLIAKEAKKHKNKRFNVKDTWLPL